MRLTETLNSKKGKLCNKIKRKLIKKKRDMIKFVRKKNRESRKNLKMKQKSNCKNLKINLFKKRKGKD